MNPHTEIIQYIFQRELIHYILCTGSILGLYIPCVKCTFSVSILFRRLLLKLDYTPKHNILLFIPLHLRETYHSLIFWIEPRPAPICPILLSWLFSMKLLNRLTEHTEEFILKLHWTNCTFSLFNNWFIDLVKHSGSHSLNLSCLTRNEPRTGSYMVLKSNSVLLTIQWTSVVTKTDISQNIFFYVPQKNVIKVWNDARMSKLWF